MTVGEVILRLEADGGKLWLDGERMRYRFPGPAPAEELAFLRDRKPEVREFLARRWPSTPVPKAPFEIVKDELKTAPVWLSQHEVVTDVFKFATSTLGQLRRKLETPRAHVGWTVAQLLARLQAVGLTVVVDPEFVKSIPTTNEVQ